MISNFGTQDIGILMTFLLNIHVLKKGESLMIHPNEPHCYLEGELVECMINSDNVVRGGLTPKLKDTDTLIEILPYDMMQESEITPGVSLVDADGVSVIDYRTGYKEFKV
jgi:mannose-6-phosphate isomerase class I